MGTQDSGNRQVETGEEATLAPEIYTTSNENIVSIKQAIAKKYRNIVPIKAGYLPSLVGNEASNQVTSGYDKYKNELLKKQQKQKYGLLKPIKPVDVKPKTTTASTLSTVSPSSETTIIDGFTIPKVSTTIKSKSYEDIKPKALVSKGYSPNDINKITDTVKKIVAEKISSELKHNIFAQEEMAPMEGREESSNDESTVALTTDTIVTVDDTIVTIVPSMEAETTAKSISEVTENAISVEVPVTAVSSTPEAWDESEEEMVTTVPTVSENLRNNNGESNQEVSTLMESKSQNNINKEEAITTEQTETETTQTLSSYTSTEPITTEKIFSEQKYTTEIPTTMNDFGKPLISESTTTTAHENKPTTQQTTDEENLEEEVTTHMIVRLMEDLSTVASAIPHDAQKNENMMEAALEVSQPKSEEDSPTPPSTTALPITLQSNQDDALINLEISTLKPEVPTTTQPPPTQSTTKQSTTTGITINNILEAENIIDIDSKTPEKSPRSSKSTTTKSTTAKLAKTKSTRPQPTTIQPRTTQSVTSQSEATLSSETASTKPELVNTQTTTTQTTASPSTTLQSTPTEIAITQSETMQPTTTRSTTLQPMTTQTTTLLPSTLSSSTSQLTTILITTTQSTTAQPTINEATTKENLELTNLINIDSKAPKK